MCLLKQINMQILATTFQALQAHLVAHAPLVRTIDLWNEQPTFHAQELPIITPAVYIEFLGIDWNTIGTGPIQHGYCTIRLHIAQHIVADTFAIDTATATNQPLALARFAILQQVHDALQNFANPNLKSLNRIASDIDTNHDGLLVDTINYRTTIIDDLVTTNANNPYTIAIMPPFQVTPNTIP